MSINELSPITRYSIKVRLGIFWFKKLSDKNNVSGQLVQTLVAHYKLTF